MDPHSVAKTVVSRRRAVGQHPERACPRRVVEQAPRGGDVFRSGGGVGGDHGAGVAARRGATCAAVSGMRLCVADAPAPPRPTGGGPFPTGAHLWLPPRLALVSLLHVADAYNPLLIECMVDEWELGLRRLVSGAGIGVIPHYELGLHALAGAVIRPVLTTLPSLVADKVRWLTTLTTRVDWRTAFPYLSTLLQTLVLISDTAPARLRSSASLPAAVAAAYHVFAPDSSPSDPFGEVGYAEATGLVLALYAAMAPTGTRSAVALRSDAPVMAILVAAASTESAGTSFIASPTVLVAHVALEAVRSPAGRLPPAVKERRALWATTAVMTGQQQSLDVCAAARLLDALCQHQAPPGSAPWAPASFPLAALRAAASVLSTRCWGVRVGGPRAGGHAGDSPVCSAAPRVRLPARAPPPAARRCGGRRTSVPVGGGERGRTPPRRGSRQTARPTTWRCTACGRWTWRATGRGGRGPPHSLPRLRADRQN